MSGLDHLAILVGEPRHAEVGDLAQLIVIHEDVSGGEVAVDDLRRKGERTKLHRENDRETLERCMFHYVCDCLRPARMTGDYELLRVRCSESS